MRKGISRSRIRKHNKKRRKSSIEILVASWLELDGISFKAEGRVGRCHVDIVLGKKKAIELNGCYWHCHTCRDYPNGMTNKDKAVRLKDQRRYNYLIRKGYDLLVLWECFILGQPDKAREQLREFANG